MYNKNEILFIIFYKRTSFDHLLQDWIVLLHSIYSSVNTMHVNKSNTKMEKSLCSFF